MKLLPLLLVSLVALSAFGQNQSDSCEEQLQRWKDWGAVAIPQYNEMKQQNDKLDKENVAVNLVAAAFSVGCGIGFAFLFIRWLRRIRPFSTGQKQLLTLVTATLWVTVAVAVSLSSHLGSPINAAAMAFLLSLPALLFGGTLFWWFSRTLNTAHQ
jgi:hypothetical protein